MIHRDLNEITAFLAVAREGGFTAASEKTGNPKSYLSRKLADLEKRLELRLMNRTTRSVSLTEDGERYYEACEKAMSEIEDVESAMEESLDNPTGLLRVTCPVEFGPILAERICQEFLIKYPNITLEIFPTNQIVDLVRDRFDVAIRPARLAQQDMVAISMGKFQWRLYASKLWIATNMKVKQLEDLKDRQLLAFNPTGKYRKTWRLAKMSYTPRFVTGNLTTLLTATLKGAGVASLPDFLVQSPLKEKKLGAVLPKFHERDEEIFALYSSRHHKSSRMRVFLDYLKNSNMFRL